MSPCLVTAHWMQRCHLAMDQRTRDESQPHVRVQSGKGNYHFFVCENEAKWISAAAWENTFCHLQKGGWDIILTLPPAQEDIDFCPLFQKTHLWWQSLSLDNNEIKSTKVGPSVLATFCLFLLLLLLPHAVYSWYLA